MSSTERFTSHIHYYGLSFMDVGRGWGEGEIGEKTEGRRNCPWFLSIRIINIFFLEI